MRKPQKIAKIIQCIDGKHKFYSKWTIINFKVQENPTKQAQIFSAILVIKNRFIYLSDFATLSNSKIILLFSSK